MKQIKNSMILMLTALIWGFAFVAQSTSMAYVGPFTFNGIRSFLGGLVLLPYLYFDYKIHHKKIENSKEVLKGGLYCGLALCISSSLQQIGIMYTSVGKAGFLTALYIVLVPILGLFLKKKCSFKVWIGVVLSLIGIYLLSVTETFTIALGDILILLCAIGFAVHILVIDHFSKNVDGVLMSCIQFFVVGIISTLLALFFEEISWASIINASMPILYAGILSSGVGYTLQIVGQKNMNPTVASMILSLESVFSVLAGALLLNQFLSIKELTGCVLVFIAIVLAQLPDKKMN